MARAVAGEKYRHRKGGIYTTMGIAEHTETKEKMVVYERDSDGEMFVRPLAMFEDGRFERVDG